MSSPLSKKLARPMSSGYTSGHRVTSSHSTSMTRSHHGNQRYSFVEDMTAALRRKTASDLGAGVCQSIEETSFIKLVELIRQERLTSLPHKGSQWDTVLIRALYFAERLHGFESAVQGLATGVTAAAQLGYGHARLLLELGHENSRALDAAFGLFYKCSLTVSSLLDQSELLGVTNDNKEQLCMMYTDLLTLVVEAAIKFYRGVHDNSAHGTSVDLYEAFGGTIDTFRHRRRKIVDGIWSYYIDSEGFDEEHLSISALERWLAPQDRVLEMLGTEHTAFADQQAEYTCLWFQDELTSFVKSTNEVLLVNGPAGSGKTTLAGSMLDRLQRPIARRSYSTLFCFIGSSPAQATTLQVVKTLLYQLLSSRVGNMTVYRALVYAHETAAQTADPKAYEDHLWQALTEVLQHPQDREHDTILVVDGLGELAASPPAGQALLERLSKTVGRAKRVKMIALSQKLTLPAGARGTTRELKPEDTRADMQAVALKSLAHCRHFTSKPGHEQETLLASIIAKTNGHFTTLYLTTELLATEKTPEAFGKTLQQAASPIPVPELITRLFANQPLSPEASLLLAWVATAARPLTYEELQCLFHIDPEKVTRTERHVDVHHLAHALRPLLFVHHDVVRFRDNIIRDTVQQLSDKGKLPIHIKHRPLDLVLRGLTYAKINLQQGEPSLDNSDRELPARLFSRLPFLEYVVRYSMYHLGQTPIAPMGTKEPKPSPELQKVFPESTLLPILEWICWDEQFPGAQEVDLHLLAGRLRKSIFKENHPTVLQSYINVAMYYEPMGNDREAAKYYYLVLSGSQKVLGAYHPVTVETANRYLILTEAMVTTSRTEIMTQRETVLLLLSNAYERQFGANADIVLQTRQLLAEFYNSINEEQRAEEILRVVYNATIDRHGHDSAQVRDIGNHLRVQLDRGSKGEDLKQYERGLLIDYEDEEQDTEEITIDRVRALLLQAERYASENKSLEAEQTYADLWQQLSTRCRTSSSSEWHVAKIDTVNAYSQFLKTQNRETETAAILTGLSEEYRHHELSHSEAIVSRLTNIAHNLRSVGQYATALAIYKQAASYYSSTNKQQSSSARQLEEEIDVTSTQTLQSAAASASSSEQTSRVSEASTRSAFYSRLSDTSKSLDQHTLTLAVQLTSQYMVQRNYEEAVAIIESTIRRTWSSFFATSLHHVTMSATYLEQFLHLVEQLAECYRQQRLFEKVEDVYLRLFYAALSSSQQHKDLLIKAKTNLIAYYDKYGYPDKSIAILQELVAVYRKAYGSTHDLTIDTLHELGSRCRSHARTHPYWIDYYQQISTSLNKDASVCHERSLEATTLVAQLSRMEHRYNEAQTAFAILWNTYIHQDKAKQIKQFSDAHFVQQLFDHYYQSLEATQATWETLYQLSKQHRETSQAVFGAQSEIAFAATMALARITQMSETHTEEAISYFEAASASRSASSKSASSSAESRELRQAVTTLYKRRITSQASVSSETIQKAAAMYQEQLVESRNAYGYHNESTLNSLHEFAQLQCRAQKSEVALRELQTTIVEINTKTTSSEAMLESAQSIVRTFQACGLTQQCHELAQELHFQLIAKEKRKSSQWSFDLTGASSASLVFLAALEYGNRKDLSLTFSQILSDLVVERVYYENFQKVMKARSRLDKILIAAAPLRWFLIQRDQTVLVQSLEQQAVQLFIHRDTADLQLLSKDSPRIFIISILDHLKARRNADFIRAVIIAANRTVAKLIEQNKFAEAHDVSYVAFIYAQHHKGYHGPRQISRGFELASYLDGRGENRCPDPGLRKKLLELSNHIVREILKICGEQNINVARIALPELNELIALLGEQSDYETLISLLNTLWNTREGQKTWPSQVLVNVGQRLICARYLAGQHIKAIRLCEDVAYNLKKTHGARHPATLDTYGLLAHLYTSVGLSHQQSGDKDKVAAGLAADYFKKAVFVHEDILRSLVSGPGQHSASTVDEDDDDFTAASILRQHGVVVDEDNDGRADELDLDKGALVQVHLRLLKYAYQRLGSWPKPYSTYERLNADLFATYGKQLAGQEGVEKWSPKGFGAGKAESNDGVFVGVGDWEILPESMRIPLKNAEKEL
ncbi:hypothetical protein EJ03DRAFT_289185 [Teratosphaeria nubilosa]|uniref:NACHT domain-containing protein n=1 Tax=Teratosphaeria nubilosa TaxID=161662 RepID=A0A6G1LFT5_9PEZI|nr:hypothetical protein EJ03DRAFT_289185 [Teratosphaeria nubilosa]